MKVYDVVYEVTHEAARISSYKPNVWYRERMLEDGPIWFRFAGGDGLLMTIKQE